MAPRAPSTARAGGPSASKGAHPPSPAGEGSTTGGFRFRSLNLILDRSVDRPSDVLMIDAFLAATQKAAAAAAGVAAGGVRGPLLRTGKDRGEEGGGGSLVGWEENVA